MTTMTLLLPTQYSIQNSRLNNFSPEAKKDHFKASNIAESIKQSIMMSYPKWTSDEINEHGADMVKLITESLLRN